MYQQSTWRSSFHSEHAIGVGFHRQIWGNQIWVNGEMNYDDEGDLDGMGGQGTRLEVLGMVVVDVAMLGKVGGVEETEQQDGAEDLALVGTAALEEVLETKGMG